MRWGGRAAAAGAPTGEPGCSVGGRMADGPDAAGGVEWPMSLMERAVVLEVPAVVCMRALAWPLGRGPAATCGRQNPPSLVHSNSL